MVSSENKPQRFGTIWALDLDGPISVITPLIPATFRHAGPESALALATVMGSSPPEVYKRFVTGRSCFTAWFEGELVAYSWVSFNEEFIGELRLRLRLLPGEAYIWDCVTLPAFRQKRVFTALLVYVLQELRSEPICRVWIGANLDNLPSQRGIDRAGFHRVADLVVARDQTLRMVWLQSYPGVPENLVAEARRAFLGGRDEVWMTAL